MQSKTILNIESPVTQSIDAIKALLQWKGRAADPLPQFVELGKEESRLVLVLSNKRDAYYTTTAAKCSCPAAHYHNGPCKHQRKYFAEVKAATKPATSEPLIKRGGFKPFDEMPGERARAMLIDCHDTTALDVAYHSINEDRIMWPMEA